MSKNKRYFWIKLPTIYFNNLSQKKMRKQENGLLFQVIYLKLMLLSCNTNGIIYYQGVYDSLVEEISEEINEEPQGVEKALAYFEQNNLLEYQEHNAILPQAVDLIGSETQSTIRSRNCRERQRALQCNTNTTPLQHDATMCNTELELELDKDIDKELELELELELDKSNENATNKTLTPSNKKLKLGTYKNVILTEKEYQELLENGHKVIIDKIIDNMSNYIKSKNGSGYGAKTFETLKSWIDKDYSKLFMEMSDEEFN